jgi:hypothetical protein
MFGALMKGIEGSEIHSGCPGGLTVLVGGLEHEFYDFPYIGNFIIPTDSHIFQRG